MGASFGYQYGASVFCGRRHRDVLPGDEDDVLIVCCKFIGQLITAARRVSWIPLRRVPDRQYARLAGCLPDSPYGQPGALLFTIVVIANSFNLIDGVDGLAGSLGPPTTPGIRFLLFYWPVHFAMADFKGLISFPDPYLLGPLSAGLAFLGSITVIHQLCHGPGSHPSLEAAPAIDLPS